MKKLVIAAVVVFAVAVSSAFAQTCPGGGCGSGDKDKSGKKKDGSTNQTVAPVAFEL